MEKGKIVSCTTPEAMLEDKTLEQIFRLEIEAVGNPPHGYILKK